MTPEEKAIELVKQMGYAVGSYINDLVPGIAKSTALICCDEILQGLFSGNFATSSTEVFKYWQQVKIEIEKI